MKKLWRWLRTLDAGEWIALVVFLGASAFVLALVAANTWSVVVGSLQPEIHKVKGTDYDLIAQRSMSAAAWWMVAFTGVSLVVGTTSLVLLKMNFDEARKVTAEAARSAKAAEDAVVAAREATEASAAMGRAQVRAFIGMDDVKINIHGNEVFVAYNVLNSGQSPAYSLVVFGKARVWADKIELPAKNPEPESLHMIRTAGSAQYHTVFKIEPVRFADKLEVMCEIRINYWDIFNDHHSDNFTYKHAFEARSNLAIQRLMDDVLGSMA